MTLFSSRFTALILHNMTRSLSATSSGWEEAVAPITAFQAASLAGQGRVNPVVAETGMGKPPFKASEGGRIDILREWEEITQSELQQGSGAQVLLTLRTC